MFIDLKIEVIYAYSFCEVNFAPELRAEFNPASNQKWTANPQPPTVADCRSILTNQLNQKVFISSATITKSTQGPLSGGPARTAEGPSLSRPAEN